MEAGGQRDHRSPDGGGEGIQPANSLTHQGERMEMHNNRVWPSVKPWKAAASEIITQPCNPIRDSNGERKETLTVDFLPTPVIISTILKSRVFVLSHHYQFFCSFIQ